MQSKVIPGKESREWLKFAEISGEEKRQAVPVMYIGFSVICLVMVAVVAIL